MCSSDLFVFSFFVDVLFMNNLSCNLIELVVLTIPKTQKNENVASCEKKMQQTYKIILFVKGYCLCLMSYCLLLRRRSDGLPATISFACSSVISAGIISLGIL